MNDRIKYPLATGICLSILCFAAASGQYPLSLAQQGQALWHAIGGDVAALDSKSISVFWHLRLPRILAALMIGAGLAASGAAYQGMFRNPLVSPDILGVSAGAGLGAVLGIYLDLSVYNIQLFAFLGGLLVVALVCLLARLSRQGDPVLSLVLVGIAIGALCGAGISLMKLLADPYSQLPSITFWLMGGLSDITLEDLKSSLLPMILGLVPLMLLRWRMNLLSLTDDEASSLGLNIAKTRLIFILAATLLTAAAVSIAGIIGWLGLVVPHIARILVGADFRRLLPMSMLLGAFMLLLTDTLARTLAPIELPLGILTACIGAPFFMFLLLRGGGRGQ
ncbi:iron ABC transporter permease [Shewanella algae]|uniref:FecCD family ABC transporter permease n=1 Tax=Shewanella TaxID=22 RepID=UPI0004B5C6E1|nr:MULTISPECIES: iron ABC transporter permease [Shewanella]MBO2594036.1 iron ABC transporter permease [Shewanella algae]